MTEISILIRTCNEAPFLKRTLEALLRQRSSRPFEVVLCDDGSTDGTPSVVAEFKAQLPSPPCARFVEVRRPEGIYRPGRNLNAMVRAAEGRIVVFNNADAVPLGDDWLENLVAPLREGRADTTFANQLPRPDADPLVRKDSECAFGDGRISSRWEHFYSLASSAAMRADLLANPFDETLIYSEDIEWAHRRAGFRKLYVPGARVEHSHNYTALQLKKRFYGEGYAEAQIFHTPPPSFARLFLGIALETARDLRYLLRHPADWRAAFVSPYRRFLQRAWRRRGALDATAGRAPRFLSTSKPDAALHGASATAGKNILFTGVYPRLHGGLERFAQRTAALLRSRGYTVVVAGDPPEDATGYDYVLMHKLPRAVGTLRRLKAQCGDRLHFYAHDHELYCLRRHYYTPNRVNCGRVYSFFPCRLCAFVTRPAWMLRALTRPMAAFLEEMRTVHVFAPSHFTQGVLLRNGFAERGITVLAPFFTEGLPPPELCGVPRVPSAPLRLLFMGQLVAGKGAGVLLDAVALLKIPCVLTVVGTGREEAALRAKAQAIANESVKIDFEGWQEKTERYFKTADAVVFPSLWNEPHGLTGIEGYLHKVPCVAFATGGVPDWLLHGETGLLVQEKTPAALAAALAEIADPSLRNRLAENARRFAETRYAPDAFLATLLNH